MLRRKSETIRSVNRCLYRATPLAPLTEETEGWIKGGSDLYQGSVIFVIAKVLASDEPDASPEAVTIPTLTPWRHPSVYSYYPTAFKNAQKHRIGTPACAKNTTKSWCLEDADYPTSEIKQAATFHRNGVLALYQDVDVTTGNSVDRPGTLEEETYLCPSDTKYVKPLRAVNVRGIWRIIVNNVDIFFKSIVQSVRIEECLTSGDACPLVPTCYDTQCLQKSIYHRFLVYDPFDYYFPFAVETFKLPASCACVIGSYSI
ncbi:neurotrophin 1-like [Palaemon carinicauda]|uniref:neurotrophin 1-like n=1 Tax=Palaemon carinicauda TaxID=392227 RepID=UPI0035B5919F